MALQPLWSRALGYAVYDWTREMPKATRAIAIAGMFIQGYAIWTGFSRSLIWPQVWPRNTVALFLIVIALYFVGYCLQNAALASEFIRKTQLESDQAAAAQIQRTLQPETIANPPGYEIATHYKPFRVVGGDYFDVIELPGGRTLFAVADVSGKGVPAALLAANIQALVRSLSATSDLATLAARINGHLCRHTPGNRFATAVFVVLDQASGGVEYVNAGHNPPLVCGSGTMTALDPTGMALGWFADGTYEARTATLAPGSTLLLYTDGLTDAITGADPDGTLRRAMAAGAAGAMARVTSLIDPRFNEDDVTVLLVARRDPAG